MTTHTLTATTVFASATVAAGTPSRSVVDLGLSHDGGYFTAKITNGATGPTVQGEIRILVAASTSAQPNPAAAGVDWKTFRKVSGGTANSDVTEAVFEFGPGLRFVEVEVTGNTIQAITAEVLAFTYAYA